jgi:hypothetical protein
MQRAAIRFSNPASSTVTPPRAQTSRQLVVTTRSGAPAPLGLEALLEIPFHVEPHVAGAFGKVLDVPFVRALFADERDAAAQLGGLQPPQLPPRWRRCKSRHSDSNRGPTVYKTVALPTELCRRWRFAEFSPRPAASLSRIRIPRTHRSFGLTRAGRNSALTCEGSRHQAAERLLASATPLMLGGRPYMSSGDVSRGTSVRLRRLTCRVWLRGIWPRQRGRIAGAVSCMMQGLADGCNRPNVGPRSSAAEGNSASCRATSHFRASSGRNCGACSDLIAALPTSSSPHCCACTPAREV